MRTESPQEAGPRGGQSALPSRSAVSGRVSGFVLANPESEKLLPGPESGASASVRVFGLRSGQIGKRERVSGFVVTNPELTEEVGAERRIGKPAEVVE